MPTLSAPSDHSPNSISLSFNGVDFRLIPTNDIQDSPKDNDDSIIAPSCSISMVPDSNGKFTMIQMNSFTGTLYVSEQQNGGIILNDSSPASSTTNTDANNTNDSPVKPSTIEIEDASHSSNRSNGNEVKKTVTPNKGQTQLSFERKKRPRLDNNEKKAAPTKNTKKLKNSNSTPKKVLKDDTAGKKKLEELHLSHVSPLLGQSSMLDDDIDSDSDTDSSYYFTTPVTTIKNTETKNVSKPSIQELVNRAEEGLTPTQPTDDLDEMTQSQLNTIVEFDVTEGSSEFHDALTQPRIDENTPSPRWGHSMTMIENSKLLVYGGQGMSAKSNKLTTFNDLHVYDLNKKTWKKPVNCEGMPRTWHSSTYLPDRSLLISFGGERYNPKTRKTLTTDEVMVLDTEIMLWYPPSVSGQIPSGRSGHTASLLDATNELVVFGGVKNNKWQNSVAVLDTMRWRWTMPKIAGDAPRARSYHSATAVPSLVDDGSLLVIFGGNNDVESFNTVHVLDATNEEGKWSWSHPNVSGTPPSPRTGHCATLLGDNKTILVYGGWDPCDEDEDFSDDKMICGDSFLLDTETWTWRPGPNPRHMSQYGVENGGRKRTGASAVLAPGNGASAVIAFGGRIPNDTFTNDFQNMIVPQNMIDVTLK